MRLYLDANFVVYCIEGSPSLKEFCLNRLREIESVPSATLIASRLTRVEVLVKPMRLRDDALVQRFGGFFEGNNVDLFDVSNAIVDRALAIRVGTNLKLLDALHVATAVEHQATLFLTADRDIASIGALGSVSFERIPVN